MYSYKTVYNVPFKKKFELCFMIYELKILRPLFFYVYAYSLLFLFYIDVVTTLCISVALAVSKYIVILRKWWFFELKIPLSPELNWVAMEGITKVASSCALASH